MINSTSRQIPTRAPYRASGLPQHAPRRRAVGVPIWVICVAVCAAALTIAYWP